MLWFRALGAAPSPVDTPSVGATFCQLVPSTYQSLLSLATTVCGLEEGVPSATQHALVDCGIGRIIYLGHANVICPTVDVNNLATSDQRNISKPVRRHPRTPLFNIVGRILDSF